MKNNARLMKGICPSGPISKRYQDKPELQRQLRDSFRERGYVKLPGLLTSVAFQAVTSEVNRLHWARARRDFIMPGFLTDRMMSVLSGKVVVRQSDVIASLLICMSGNT